MRRHPRTSALCAYALLALLTVGWYPLSDPGAVCPCASNTDPSMSMWSLAWVPHALLHGLNPFYSHVVWAPVGSNLARSAAIPAAALAMSPVTELLGPVVSYNLLMVASPVLAAFTAYLLCRRIGGREAPALAGGYLFGFGSYELAQLTVHANLSLVFLIPAMVHLTVRRAAREISAASYVAALAASLVAQMGLSTEVLVTALAIGGLTLVCARIVAEPPYGERLDGIVGEIALAGACAAFVAAPFIYFAVIKGGTPHDWAFIEVDGMDLLNPLIPTRITWLGGQALESVGQRFIGGNLAESGGYLSLPIVLAFLAWLATTRRRRLAGLLAVVAGSSLAVALGGRLHVAGSASVELPLNWLRNAPIVRLITPSRIVVYASLAVAVGVAAWLAERPGWPRRPAARWAGFALGAAMIFPNVGSGLWSGSPPNPAFFRSGGYRRYLERGESVLAMPFGRNGYSMLWQAETGFYFRMPEGYLGHIPPEPFASEPIVGELYSGRAVDPGALAKFLLAGDVRAIVIDRSAFAAQAGFAHELVLLGMRPVATEGVLLFESAFFLPLIAALVAGDIVAAEDGNGTLKTILTRSVGRGQVFAAKVI
ncbi:MAG: hypothetical protein KGJ43_07965, partial [Acidobacteriota bacterium]|nr:hypothetical protein [Acidobacteriota bacterium]